MTIATQRVFRGLLGWGLAGTMFAAEQLPGRYVAVGKPGLVLTLAVAADGSVTGTVVDAESSAPVVGRQAANGFSGTVGADQDKLPVAAAFIKDKLVLQVGAPDSRETFTFKRETPAAGAARTPVAAGKRNVIINGKRLSDAEVARMEKDYQVRISDADYWYDKVLGAWGIRGGATMGLTAAGLDLGGPLSADASNGNTKVFINGRELPLADLVALQRITGPVIPGRYFINARGLAGYEADGLPRWDLGKLASAQNDNPSNSWSSKITGASGFSDGTTSAVFLPGVGIVSSGN
ncbi:MAG TPA: hypothetical protein VG734_05605 [Lacunisphaera sp.]|nr:hypothetical protein [Lacunisphaera sp.]